VKFMDMTAERISQRCSFCETRILEAKRGEMCKMNESRSFYAGRACAWPHTEKWPCGSKITCEI